MSEIKTAQVKPTLEAFISTIIKVPTKVSLKSVKTFEDVEKALKGHIVMSPFVKKLIVDFIKK